MFGRDKRRATQLEDRLTGAKRYLSTPGSATSGTGENAIYQLLPRGVVAVRSWPTQQQQRRHEAAVRLYNAGIALSAVGDEAEAAGEQQLANNLAVLAMYCHCRWQELVEDMLPGMTPFGTDIQAFGQARLAFKGTDRSPLDAALHGMGWREP